MLICGIDPGISGALVLLDQDTGEYLDVADMPTMPRGKTSKRQQVNGVALAGILRKWRPGFVYLELVTGQMGGNDKNGKKRQMGNYGAFCFGHNYGIIEGALTALEIPFAFVPPANWKRVAGLKGAEKDASRALAQRLYPTAPLDRKKDIGRAEALLIARYAPRS